MDSGAILVALALEVATVVFVIIEVIEEMLKPEPNMSQVPWFYDLFMGTFMSLMIASSHWWVGPGVLW